MTRNSLNETLQLQKNNTENVLKLTQVLEWHCFTVFVISVCLITWLNITGWHTLLATNKKLKIKHWYVITGRAGRTLQPTRQYETVLNFRMSKLHLNAEERTFLNFTKISLKTLSNCRLSQNLLKNCRSPSADNWYHIVGKDVKPLSENNEIKNQIICFYVI